MQSNANFELGSILVKPGESKDIKIKVTELYISTPIFMPVTVINGRYTGPTIFVTAAIHGDELNGVEIIRQIRAYVDPQELSGRLILVPIANPISFISQARDLPDNRDLNRAFPGSKNGSMASILANTIFGKIVKRSNYGIDLHTAPPGRTNLPHIRADMSISGVRYIAKAFGSEIIFDMPGERTMLRYQACKAGIPTIVYEAGEPLRFQEYAIKKGVEGIKNILTGLDMVEDGKSRLTCLVSLVVTDHKWIRAEHGGILILKVKPGDIVKKGAEIAVNTKPFGTEVNSLFAPFTGLVVGTTTLPMAIPGSAICHIVKLDKKLGDMKRISRVFKINK